MGLPDFPTSTLSRGARVRAGLRVLAWTAPLALILALPRMGESARLQDDGNAERTRAVADDAEAGEAARSRPLAFLSTQRTLSYPFEHVWPTAVRYLRIDRKFKVTDRDEEAGYMLFEFQSGPGRTGSGSMEMIKTTDASGRPSVQLMVTTTNGAAHLPHSIAEGLELKIRSERGAPPPPPPAEKPPEEAPKEPPPDDHILHPNGPIQ